MSRRWLQFSLRGFLLAMTAFAVWLGLVAEKAERQKEAVALLEEWGATIHYEHEWQGPHKPPNPTAQPPGSPWLRRLLGAHYFDTVVNVELVSGDRQLTAVEMALARQGKVPGPPRLLVLTDADFAALGHLPHLRRLKVIADLNVTPAGLRNLESLTRLEMLILDNTSGKATGGVTDDTLRFVNRLPRLSRLDLEGHPITDVALTRIRWPFGLTRLNLSGSKITDTGLERLGQIATLRRLIVMGCPVSASGVERVQRALPKCSVIVGTFDDLER